MASGFLEDDHDLLVFIDGYIKLVESEFVERWNVWPVVIEDMAQTEVIAGLLRRQVSLAKHMAMSPNNWSPEFAPIVFRCMVELHIWLAWILESPAERSKKFIEDGLGKEKLIIKHRLDQLAILGIREEDDPIIQASKVWLESQRYHFLVDVNLSGSWSGLDVRSMAEEAGCRDLYRFTYPQFSAAVHSTWNHISKFDLEHCENPLHGDHRIPRLELSLPMVEMFIVCAKYLAKSFKLVDDKLGTAVAVRSGYDYISEFFKADGEAGAECE